MTSLDGAPIIPDNLKIYDSYEEDPKYQIKFTIVWTAFAAFMVLLALPTLWRLGRARKLMIGLLGISEIPLYTEIKERSSETVPPKQTMHRFPAMSNAFRSCLLWQAPGLGLNAGQIIVIAAYFITVIFCMTTGANLVDNSNRAGFLTIAQLPPIFLLSLKNSPLSCLLGPGHGYERLNFIHRWIGRTMFITSLIHGGLWLRNHVEYDLPILGQQKETSGIAAFGLIGVIVLSSLKPIRKWAYEIFFVIHILAMVSFFITLCYHTMYALPWIFPPLAFYGSDLLLRLLRLRIKDASLSVIDNQMTIIRIYDSLDGWTPGSHVRLRVFFHGRLFESHPLTILSAPPSISCLSDPGLILGARAIGDWTKALNEYAMEESIRMSKGTELKGEALVEVPILTMIDGPYGGCSIDLGESENVLLVSGGSGATFALSLLDDILGRCLRKARRGGEITKKIEFAWCIRSFGSIQWFAEMLINLARTALGSSIDLHITIYVTCICNPDAIPDIPNCDVLIERPAIREMVTALITDANQSAGGLAVCASGPASLTREASNVVARTALTRGFDIGSISLHTEVYSM